MADTMRNYLSFGAGVNSVAMYLVLVDEGMTPGDAAHGFEAIYVDHGGDWPETHKYVESFVKNYPVTILTPNVGGESNLYDYSARYKMIPSRRKRWCTDKFKVRVINKHITKPCFSLIGFSADEAHRAKITTEKGVENRFPLVERGIDRARCIEIIKSHGLPVPMKSGCYFCPFQRVGQWKKLRNEHPDLFCKAKKLEDDQIIARAEHGKGPLYLSAKPLSETINERQGKIFEADEYPPCQCGL